MTSLTDVHACYKKWLHVPDPKRIDIVLATALCSRYYGTPIWLIIVGPSGDWKTQQLETLDNPERAKLVGSITPNTLISGDKRATDLVPLLNNKIFLVKDMAQMLTLPPDAKAAIWAQLRDLYDGKITKAAGTGKDQTYEVYTTLIAASTPVIDEQMLMGQALGTRELIWRTDLDVDVNKDADNTMDAVLKNEGRELHMRRELKQVTDAFLENHDLLNIAVTPQIDKQLKDAAQFIRIMRAVGEGDFDGNLRNVVYPEQPTRILKQLKRIFTALKCLDTEYSDERAMTVIRHLARSAGHRVRIRIYDLLLQNSEQAFSTNSIAHRAHVGGKTANHHLNVLREVGIVDKQFTEETNNYGKSLETIRWCLKDNHQQLIL